MQTNVNAQQYSNLRSTCWPIVNYFDYTVIEQ